ncbi:MAG: hypothetical protein ACI8PT_003502 [Gammaproteobacteria bacterium]|jgi:hypothetical protein
MDFTANCPCEVAGFSMLGVLPLTVGFGFGCEFGDLLVKVKGAENSCATR